MAVNNFRLSPAWIVASWGCATNSSHPNTGVEIFEPGRGLLLEQDSALRKRQSYLSARRVFSFSLVRKPGVAPGPSASQAEMLLLHHDPDLKLEPLIGLA